MNSKLKTIYLGTPDFSVPTLDLLNNHPNIDLKYVVSMPDRPAGRGQQLKSPEVIEYAKNNKIKFYQTENINKEEDFLSELEKDGVDLIVVLAFAQFLSDKLLNIPSLGCFNIHTSLLPKYRGAAPIQYAILNGDDKTGVSIQKMVKKMDAGDLVKDRELTISPSETGGQLYTRLKYEAAGCLNDFLVDAINNKITYTKQNENNVSFAPTLKRDDGHLQFSKDEYESIRNRIRALYPWPGTFCFLNDKRLKVFNIIESNQTLNSGEIKIIKNQIHVGTKTKSMRLIDIQLEGKKRCSDVELLNGLRVKEIILK